MKKIKLNLGQFALVDDSDFERVSKYCWYVQCTRGRRCAVTNGTQKSGLRKSQYMHRLIMQAPTGVLVDHINGDALDNRRSNLRLCSASNNNCNSSKRRSAHRFKGVRERDGIFLARIRFNHKEYHLGTFASAELAAEAYNKAALLYHGEFASLNRLEKGNE